MSEMTPSFRTQQKSRNVHIVYVDFKKNGDEFPFLWAPDIHFDSPHCDRKRLKDDFDEIKAVNGAIFTGGDTLDLMQAPHDKRRNYSDLRDEYKATDYFNRVIEDSSKFFGKYAKQIVLMARGNHETSVTKNNGIDILSCLTQSIASDTGVRIPIGGYTGFVRLQFSVKGTRRGSKTIYYNHGTGGGGPVTKGTIQAQRRAAFVNADFVLSGHVHEEWQVNHPRISLSLSDVIEQKDQHHISAGGYKNEHEDGHGGWSIERGHPPKPISSATIRFYVKCDEIRYDIISSR